MPMCLCISEKYIPITLSIIGLYDFEWQENRRTEKEVSLSYRGTSRYLPWGTRKTEELHAVQPMLRLTFEPSTFNMQFRSVTFRPSIPAEAISASSSVHYIWGNTVVTKKGSTETARLACIVPKSCKKEKVLLNVFYLSFIYGSAPRQHLNGWMDFIHTWLLRRPLYIRAWWIWTF
jgi:hypothetical protein